MARSVFNFALDGRSQHTLLEFYDTRVSRQTLRRYLLFPNRRTQHTFSAKVCPQSSDSARSMRHTFNPR
jgi:hypothetical protein